MKVDQCYFGDCRDVMRDLIAWGGAGKVQTFVTSPPYWGLRDYGVPPSYFPAVTFVPVAGLPPITVPEWTGCLGLEPDPWMFVGHMVEVFRLVRELLADDGTLWMNLGDSYSSSGGPTGPMTGAQFINRVRGKAAICISNRAARTDSGLKPKDLCGIPWRVAFALQADGWYLRQDNIWRKPNPMPESVTDRCTKSHEYVFLLAKSERYFFDQDAILEPVADATVSRLRQPTLDQQHGSDRVPGKTNGPMKAVSRSGNKERKPSSARGCPEWTGKNQSGSVPWEGSMRNKRSVWDIPTVPFNGAHFATFPPALVEPCILAGSRPGDVVGDIFFGSGTVGQVAQRLGRRWIGIELNEKNAPLQADRTRQMGLELVA